MIEIKKQNWAEEVANFKGVVVVDFYATWCGPCKMLSPLMEELSKENKDKGVKYVKVNVDEEQELASQYGILSIPTVMFFKDGKKVYQHIGVSAKKEYLALVEKAKTYDLRAKKNNEIKVFSTPTCPYCHMLKEYLTEKKVKFTDYNVATDEQMAREMVTKSGQMGVPQLWINDEVIVGFNKPAIEAALGL